MIVALNIVMCDNVMEMYENVIIYGNVTIYGNVVTYSNVVKCNNVWKCDNLWKWDNVWKWDIVLVMYGNEKSDSEEHFQYGFTQNHT